MNDNKGIKLTFEIIEPELVRVGDLERGETFQCSYGVVSIKTAGIGEAVRLTGTSAGELVRVGNPDDKVYRVIVEATYRKL